MTAAKYHQDWLTDFDIIRSFHDKEVTEVINKLLNDTPFIEQFNLLFGEYLNDHPGNISIAGFVEALQQATNVEQLQLIEKSFLDEVLHSTLKNVSISGLEIDEKNTGHLLVSNHRDIVMDPLLINWSLLNKGSTSSHCAIGDNLLVAESGKLIALLNKCFAVLRSIRSPKAMVKAMKTQSAYIRHLRFNQQANIWIAQKEGRSKDNSDTTNPALIKMLGLAKPKDVSLAEYLKELRITPVSISYEWDPCDKQKAEELILAEQGNYEKHGEADLKAVKDGLVGNKGNIQLNFDTDFYKSIPDDATHQDIAHLIDQSIQKNYRLYPVNYAALRLLDIDACSAEEIYSNNEITAAAVALKERTRTYPEEIRKKIYYSYANPAIKRP